LIAFLAGAGFAGVVLAKKSLDMSLFLGKPPKEASRLGAGGAHSTGARRR